MLRRIGVFVGKLALSFGVVTLFLFLSAKLPFFRSESPQFMTVMPLDAGTASLGEGVAATMSFATSDSRFEGSFFGLGEDSGFQMTERDVPGACAGAGLRYLEAQCPDCVITPVAAEAAQPGTLFFVRPDGSAGTIFADCTERVSAVLVRVPELSFVEDTLNLSGAAVASASSSLVPRLASVDRVSSMTLGDWAIAVDAIDDRTDALQDMGQLLRDAGWREQSQGESVTPAQDQRVFVRGEAQQSALCVITLNRADDGYQLVTMMNI